MFLIIGGSCLFMISTVSIQTYFNGADRVCGLAAFIRCQRELEVGKLRVRHLHTLNFDDIPIQFLHAVCIGF